MSEQVFLYCERGTASVLMAEPLNAVSNFAFALVAVLIWRRAGAAGMEAQHKTAMRLVAGLALAVAVGSLAFHATATRLAQVGDVVPIAVIVLVLIRLSLTWVCGLPRSMAAVLTGTVGAAALATAAWSASAGCGEPVAADGALRAMPLHCLNGSWPYIPVLLALAAVAVTAGKRGCGSARALGMAAIVFALALTARSLDLALCGDLPAVLHAIWHVGAAATLALTATALVTASTRIGPVGQRS